VSITGAGEYLLDVRVDGARRGLFGMTVPGEQRDRILSEFGQRKIHALCGVRRAGTTRTRTVALGRRDSLSVAEHQCLGDSRCVEVAHAPVAGAQAIGGDGVVDFV
jgi:hypothetical protein